MTMSDSEVQRILDKIDVLGDHITKLREQVASLKTWQTQQSSSTTLKDLETHVKANSDRIARLENWKSMAVGVIVGAQTIGMVLTGVVIRLLTKLGWF